MLHAACYMLHATSYMIHATCYILHATCHMPHATCYMLHAACYILHATCYMLHAACHMPHAACCMLQVTRRSCMLTSLLHATCYMLHATCCMLHATRCMLHAACYTLPGSSRIPASSACHPSGCPRQESVRKDLAAQTSEGSVHNESELVYLHVRMPHVTCCAIQATCYMLARRNCAAQPSAGSTTKASSSCRKRSCRWDPRSTRAHRTVVLHMSHAPHCTLQATREHENSRRGYRHGT